MSLPALHPQTRFFVLPEPLALESGEVLPQVRVAYRTWGKLAAGGGNAVLVCHALTGSADVDRWWPELLGAGRALDPADLDRLDHGAGREGDAGLEADCLAHERSQQRRLRADFRQRARSNQ